MSEFSLILVLQKENKQNSNMTWQKYKLNLRNSHLLEEFFQTKGTVLLVCFGLLAFLCLFVDLCDGY